MFLPLGDLSDPGIGPLSLESPGLQAGFYCWAIRDFNFLVVVSFKCICQDFFFNHEKVLKILSYPLFINWDHGFSLRYVNVVHCLLACLLDKMLQLCPTLCYPHGQQPTSLLCPHDSLVWTLLWVAISFSNVVHDTNAFYNDETFFHSRKNHTCVYCTILIIWIDINNYLYMYIHTHMLRTSALAS